MNIYHSKWFAWFKLTVYIGCLWFCVFWAAPLLQEIKAVKTMHLFIEQNGIDAAALYYTDSPECNGADIHLRDALRYP